MNGAMPKSNIVPSWNTRMYKRTTTLVNTNVYADGTTEDGKKDAVPFDMTFVTDKIRNSNAYGCAYRGRVALWQDKGTEGSKARSLSNGEIVSIFSDFSRRIFSTFLSDQLKK